MDDSLSLLEHEIDKRIDSLEQVNTDYIDLLSFLHKQHKNLQIYNSLSIIPDDKDKKITKDDVKSKKDDEEEDLVFGNNIEGILNMARKTREKGKGIKNIKTSVAPSKNNYTRSSSIEQKTMKTSKQMDKKLKNATQSEKSKILPTVLSLDPLTKITTSILASKQTTKIPPELLGVDSRCFQAQAKLLRKIHGTNTNTNDATDTNTFNSVVIPPSIALELLDSTSNYLYSTLPSLSISKAKSKEQKKLLLQMLDMTGIGNMIKRLDRFSSTSEMNMVDATKVFKAWYKVRSIFNILNHSTIAASSSSSSSSTISDKDSQLIEEYLQKYKLMESILKCPMATPLINHSLCMLPKSNSKSKGNHLIDAMKKVDSYYNSLDTHYHYFTEFTVSKSLLKHVIRELKSCMLQSTIPNSSDNNKDMLMQWRRTLSIYRSLLNSLLADGLHTDYTFVSKY